MENLTMLGYSDADYPAKLRQLKNPPPELYVRGNAGVLSGGPIVAVVGSRNATAYGLTVTADFCRDFCEAGFTVITGGAKGIDSAAAQTAVKFGGKVILVLGCGADIVYPPENKELFEKVLEGGGAIVSEFPPGTQPLSSLFPQRNRIIAALSDGCVVTEAGLNSGALITADICLDLRRPLYAVPGNITSSASAGTNNLLKSGAAMATDGLQVAADIRLSLSFSEKFEAAKQSSVPKVSKEQPAAKPKPQNLSADEEMILLSIKKGKSTLAEISAEIGMNEAALAPTMVMLELKKVIRREFGGKYTEY